MCSTAASPVAKGTIDAGHENAPLQIQDADAHAAGRVPDVNAGSGSRGRIVMGTKQSRLLGQIRHDGTLVPDVIAGGQQIDFALQKFVGDLGCDSETGSRVFDVGNAEINAVFLDDCVQLFLKQPSAGFPENITNEKGSHRFRSVVNRQQKKPPRRRVADLFEPCYQGGALRAASGKQVPEGKARTRQSDTKLPSNRMLAQIIVAITNIAGADAHDTYNAGQESRN